LRRKLPGLEVDVGDFVDRRFVGRLTVLLIRAGDERLNRGHHPHVPNRRDEAGAAGAAAVAQSNTAGAPA